MAKAPASETHRALARSIVQHLLDESAEALIAEVMEDAPEALKGAA